MHKWRALPIAAGVIVLCLVATMWRPTRALETPAQENYQQLLEDTQALADAYNGLTEQNAMRSAEIARLQQDIASLRAELSALKGRR